MQKQTGKVAAQTELTHGSLFAGIGGFDLGFERAGFRTVWQVELEPFCRRILERHFPHARRFADIRRCGKRNLESVDVVTAGVPCQDVSVAGRRKGLAGERTGLFYEFARILSELRPAWFVFENVPGLFSSNRGRDFAEVLRVLMVECGYGVSWRVLDSRFFGVAQRRRRLFLVGRFGKPCPAEVLFESAGGAGNPAEGGEAREGIAGPLGGGAYGTGRRDEDDPNLAVTLSSGNGANSNNPGRRREDDFNLAIANMLREADGHHGRSSPRGDGCDNLVAFAENQRGELRASAVAPQLSAGGGKPGSGYSAVAYEETAGTIGAPSGGRRTTDLDGHGAYISAAVDADRVRTFAGLPEGLDSARYRALGNAVTVTVAEWLARRLLKAILSELPSN